MKLSTQKAFTLIEILLVTSIISLLSTVVVNESKTSRLKADDAHMKTESHQLANAINLYKNDNKGKVPVGDQQKNDRNYAIVYENDTVDGGAAYRESMQKLVDGGYIPEIPTSPAGENYSYYVTADEEKAMFAAKLNLESSGSSNKNSCEFVDVSTSIGNPFIGCTQNYNVYNELDPDVIVSDLNILCPIYGTPSGPVQCGEFDFFCNPGGFYPNGNGVLGIDVCPYSSPMPLTATVYCKINNYGQNDCSLDEYTSQFICEPAENNTPCDGSNNSDYCSCI